VTAYTQTALNLSCINCYQLHSYIQLPPSQSQAGDVHQKSRSSPFLGRAMVQVVSRRPTTAEAWVRSPVSPCGICGGQSGTGTGFSPSTSVFPCQFHSTGAPLLRKRTKIIVIVITGLHKKTQGCGASVASAAGPFTTKKFFSSVFKVATF
jgi:hypothetical protein